MFRTAYFHSTMTIPAGYSMHAMHSMQIYCIQEIPGYFLGKMFPSALGFLQCNAVKLALHFLCYKNKLNFKKKKNLPN